MKGTVSGHYWNAILVVQHSKILCVGGTIAKKVIQLVLLIWQTGILLIFEKMQNDSIFRLYKCAKPSCCPVSSKK